MEKINKTLFCSNIYTHVNFKKIKEELGNTLQIIDDYGDYAIFRDGEIIITINSLLKTQFLTENVDDVKKEKCIKLVSNVLNKEVRGIRQVERII